MIEDVSNRSRVVAAKVEARNELQYRTIHMEEIQRDCLCELTYCMYSYIDSTFLQPANSFLSMAIVTLILSVNSSIGYVQQPYQQYPPYPPAVPANWPMYPHPGYSHHGYPHPGSQYLPHLGYYGQPTPYQFPPAGSLHPSIPPQHHIPGPQVQGPSCQGNI